MPAVLALGASLAVAQNSFAPAPTPEETEIARLDAVNGQLRAQLRAERLEANRRLAGYLTRHSDELERVRGSLRATTSVDHAIGLAAAAYGQSAVRLRQVAFCESRLSRTAQNGQYQGIFQFGLPLWTRTPYGTFERTDPYASALAAGWAFSRGMASHWPICGR